MLLFKVLRVGGFSFLFFSFHKLQSADNIFLFHYVANSSYRVCSTAAFDEGTETGKIPVLCVSMQVLK